MENNRNSNSRKIHYRIGDQMHFTRFTFYPMNSTYKFNIRSSPFGGREFLSLDQLAIPGLNLYFRCFETIHFHCRNLRKHRVFDNMFPIDHLFDRPFIFHKRISFYKKTQLSFTIRDQNGTIGINSHRIDGFDSGFVQPGFIFTLFARKKQNNQQNITYYFHLIHHFRITTYSIRDFVRSDYFPAFLPAKE